MTVLVQALLFLSSYSPLFGIFALLETFGRGVPALICLGLAVIGAAAAPLLFLIDRRTTAQTLGIRDANPRDADVLAYVASYLVPFATYDAVSLRQRLAVIVFVVLIAVLYVRLQLFYVNPLLALVGYRIYQVSTTGGTPVVLMTRRPFVAVTSSVQAVRLSNYVWREKSE